MDKFTKYIGRTGCIELSGADGSQYFFSVAQYEEHWEERMKGVAPPVQHLTGEWHPVRKARIRVCNHERYDQQMRWMLGIDELPYSWWSLLAE